MIRALRALEQLLTDVRDDVRFLRRLIDKD